MRLGDLDALLERADEVIFMGFRAVERKKNFMDLVSAVAESCKTIDAVPVVRCKDCKYWQDNNGGYPHDECRWGKGETPDPDDYCSYGERKDGDT